VILGASKVKQLEENLGAINILPKVTADIMLQIDEVLSNKPGIPEF
jgi:aryl-alcohol dehydrogenase-like predicted oxidoreductase